MDTAIKVCCDCKQSKSLNNFNKDSKKSFGVSSQCKVCKALYDKSRPPKPYKPRILSEEQRNRKLARQKVYRENKKLLSGYTPKRVVFKTEEERKARRTVMMRAWRKKYRKENVVDKLTSRLRSRMKKVLLDKKNKNKKTDTRAYYSSNVGCKGPDLIKHIESQWTEGMTWDNYGFGADKWTIDHIRPIADFIKSGEDPRKANYYTNLRPLWFTDNMKKGSKYNPSSNPTPNSTPEYESEPESDNEGDTVVEPVKGGGQ